MDNFFAGGIDGGRYKPPSTEYLASVASDIVRKWEEFLHNMNEVLVSAEPGVLILPEGADMRDYYRCNYHDIIQVVARVRKRVVDIECFHEGMKTSECKILGLYTYWLSRIKPFFIEDSVTEEGEIYYFTKDFASKVNAEFGYYYLCIMLSNLANSLGLTMDLEGMDPRLYNELVYNMQYRSITPESMMLLVEFMAGHMIPNFYKIWETLS